MRIVTADKTIKAIDSIIETEQKSAPLRNYCGISYIGHDCDRYIYISYHNLYKPNLSGRIIRLLDRGNDEEERFIRLLNKVGVQVKDRQKEVVINDLIKGHIDGIATGLKESKTRHIIEFKTSNDKNFKKLIKDGLKKAKYQHYVQLNTYMYGLNIPRGFYLVVNKNTDELYSEKIRLDEDVVKYHIDRATDICNSTVMPPKKSENPSWYECKLCQFYNFCHKQNVEISEELLTWY